MVETLLIGIILLIIGYTIGRLQGEKMVKQSDWDWVVSYFNGKPIRRNK